MKTASLGFTKLRTVDIVMLGLLMALGLIVAKFNVGTEFIRLNFAFVITAIMAYWYGPTWAGTIAAISDILGTLIAGTTYFPGFTLSAVLGAVLYGIFLYDRKVSIKNVVVSQLIIAVFVNTVLNTLWLTVLYKTPFVSLLPLRLAKELLVTPIQMIIIWIVLNLPQFKQITNRLFLNR
ncbi:folate family ECF transporter S component [Lentilactobacillus sp. Marseille-Q4993]|uniref:folate family ECF transporter S component n=1 Tax=Lentilactobacillus sp. Marseille-Q4993 TaxID=3039492 RepID=UPI0024BC95B5|nr:folate family ECF transporter S component [Lentilactobacillus sp. Marseille-Q4993]